MNAESSIYLADSYWSSLKAPHRTESGFFTIVWFEVQKLTLDCLFSFPTFIYFPFIFKTTFSKVSRRPVDNNKPMIIIECEKSTLSQWCQKSTTPMYKSMCTLSSFVEHSHAKNDQIILKSNFVLTYFLPIKIRIKTFHNQCSTYFYIGI